MEEEWWGRGEVRVGVDGERDEDGPRYLTSRDAGENGLVLKVYS